MTRRLRMAGMGICTFMLPACLGTTKTEDPYLTGAGPGYVLMDRPGAAPANTRLQRMGGPSAPASLEVTALKKNEPVVMPPAGRDELVRAVDAIESPTVVPVKHETPVPLTPPIESVLAQAPPPAPSPMRSAFVQPDSPTVAPAWPTFGGKEVSSHPLTLPEVQPKTEAPPPVVLLPNQSSLIIPPTEGDLPKPVESNISLKVPDQSPPVAAVTPALPSAAAEALLLQAMKAFQNNQPQEALEHLKHLDTTNQELLMYLMPLMVRLGEGNSSALAPDELAMLVDRLQTASGMLKSKAALRADRVCFCKGVRKFADLDPFEPGYVFRPGEMVFLYAELKNFTCEPANTQPAQGYNAQTRGCNVRLTTTLELRDARQNLIWRTDLNKNDYALTPPQDYYHTYRFCIPEKLPAGTYTLWVNIVDKPTGRAVRKPVEMRVGQS